MKYKNIFVLTDNEVQYKKFKHLLDELAINAKFEFYRSSQSYFTDTNLKAFDVNQNYQFIIDSFDLAFSLHCKQFFPQILVESIPCINVHPGYNPYNRGWYPQVFAILEKKIIGATIHLMDTELDNGKIIARKEVKQYKWDTSGSLYNRILEAEIVLLRNNLRNILKNNFRAIRPEKKGTLKLQKDFKSLCQIDMKKRGTFNEFYDLLRSLSHDDYNNSFFIDPETGHKIFIKLIIKKEIEL